MNRNSVPRMLAAAAVGILLLPALATHSTAAAARLVVTASPIQTWTIVDGLPALPEPDADLGDCGDGAPDELIGCGPEDVTAGDGAGELTGPGPVESDPAAQGTQAEGGTAGEASPPPGPDATAEPSPSPVPSEEPSSPPSPMEESSPPPVSAEEPEPVSDAAPDQEVDMVSDASAAAKATADAGPSEAPAGE